MKTLELSPDWGFEIYELIEYINQTEDQKIKIKVVQCPSISLATFCLELKNTNYELDNVFDENGDTVLVLKKRKMN